MKKFNAILFTFTFLTAATLFADNSATSFPWAGHYVESSTGLDISISANGAMSANYDDVDFPNRLTTVTGLSYRTSGVGTIGAGGIVCNVEVPVEVGYDSANKILRVEFQIGQSYSCFNCACSAANYKTDHHDLILK